MGAIITIIANITSFLRIPNISNGERKRKLIQRNKVIEELKMMEHCTHCYLSKKAEELVGPWLDGQHPWNDTSLIDLVRSEGDRYQDELISSDCCHSEEEKYQNPPPDLINSLFGKKTVSNSRIIPKCLICEDNWEECLCLCEVCGGDSCLNTLMSGYHERMDEESAPESDQGVDCAPTLTDSDSEPESEGWSRNYNYNHDNSA